MTKETILSRLEHNLLSMQVDDIEPLYVLYSDTKRDIKGTTLEQILNALIKLVNMGLSECIIKKRGRWQQCKELTVLDLMKRFEGQSEEEKIEYPMSANEYYFKVTKKGRLEESKSIYDPYYPNSYTTSDSLTK